MNKIILGLVISAFYVATASAEYMIKIPLEKANGGFLPNNSINFVNNTVNPDPEVEPETPEKPVPEGLEGYQNINGLMDYSYGYGSYGPYYSSRADEMTHKINSAKNDVIIVSMDAGYGGSGVYSAGLTIYIDGAVQDIVDKASIVVFSDASNSNVNCHITEKRIFMTMDQITFRDEYNTRVSCIPETFNMTEGSGLMNYSVSIK